MLSHLLRSCTEWGSTQSTPSPSPMENIYPRQHRPAHLRGSQTAMLSIVMTSQNFSALTSRRSISPRVRPRTRSPQSPKPLANSASGCLGDMQQQVTMNNTCTPIGTLAVPLRDFELSRHPSCRAKGIRNRNIGPRQVDISLQDNRMMCSRSTLSAGLRTHPACSQASSLWAGPRDPFKGCPLFRNETSSLTAPHGSVRLARLDSRGRGRRCRKTRTHMRLEHGPPLRVQLSTKGAFLAIPRFAT